MLLCFLRPCFAAYHNKDYVPECPESRENAQLSASLAIARTRQAGIALCRDALIALASRSTSRPAGGYEIKARVSELFHDCGCGCQCTDSGAVHRVHHLMLCAVCSSSMDSCFCFCFCTGPPPPRCSPRFGRTWTMLEHTNCRISRRRYVKC